MSDIYLDTLTYYKPEIDTKFSDEKTRVDAELAKRVETSELGIAGGVATLDGSGDVEPTQMPYATQTEALDKYNSTKAMTPQRTHELLDTVYQVYEHATVADITITDNMFEPLVHLLTPSEDAGIYEIKISTTFLYSVSGKSMFIRWSMDGGSTWEEYRYDAIYDNEKFTTTYVFPVTHTGGAFDIMLEGRCQDTGDIFTIKYANIMVERKK